MSTYISLHKPELLHITDEKNNCHLGASQLWYPDRWKRQAGCGPTTCANLFWYLSQTNSKGKDLVRGNMNSYNRFLNLMQEVWVTVTPGKLGVWNTEDFGKGAVSYALAHGIKLTYEALNVPFHPLIRPDEDEVSDFIIKALSNNLPIAFLNLSNGNLPNLESWHWVTIIGFSPKTMLACIYNNGKQVEIDLGLWLNTTILGGGMVTLNAT